MATLQKFKLLASQCAVVGSPTRSPTTSPVIHIRRRKTLRMLLTRDTNRNGSVFHRRFNQPPPRPDDSSDRRKRNVGDDKRPTDATRLKLKDLFLTSPPPQPAKAAIRGKEEARRMLPVTDGGLTVSRSSIRPLSATLRQRLLMRKAWRPMLMAIPEQSP